MKQFQQKKHQYQRDLELPQQKRRKLAAAAAAAAATDAVDDSSDSGVVSVAKTDTKPELEKKSVSKRLISLNNRAILSLWTGHVAQSCCLLTEASSILTMIRRNVQKKKMQQQQQQQQQEKKNMNDGDNYQNPSPTHSSNFPFIFSWVDISFAYPSHENLMIQRAVLVDDDDGDDDEADSNDDSDGLDRASRLCWAILYNLALACHLKACQAGASTEGRENFARAMGLYQMLSHSADFFDGVPACHRTTFLLGLWYNQGHIHSEFSCHELTARCVVHVQTLLIQLRFEQPSVDMSETELNLILLKPPSTAGAA